MGYWKMEKWTGNCIIAEVIELGENHCCINRRNEPAAAKARRLRELKQYLYTEQILGRVNNSRSGLEKKFWSTNEWTHERGKYGDLILREV